MISAVDLLKGIAVGAGMTNIQVEGANGQLHTNYEGKAQAAADALLKDGFDFVYVHVEAPDEMGHQGSVERKVQAVEYLDQRLIKPLKETLDASGEAYRMMVLPDHPTPSGCGPTRQTRCPSCFTTAGGLTAGRMSTARKRPGRAALRWPGAASSWTGCLRRAEFRAAGGAFGPSAAAGQA